MATTRRPDLTKKTDAEVYDLLGFHVAEAFKRISSTKTAALTTYDGDMQAPLLPVDPDREKAEPELDDFDPEGDAEEDDEPTTTAKKPKPKKAKKPEQAQAELASEEDDFDPFANPTEEEKEDDHVEEAFTSEDVRLALKAFSVIYSREAAVEIMVKVAKTDSVAKIDPKHYAKIIELAKIKRAKK